MRKELREIAARLATAQEPTLRQLEEDAKFQEVVERIRRKYPFDEISQMYRSMGSIYGVDKSLDMLTKAEAELGSKGVRAISAVELNRFAVVVLVSPFGERVKS